MRVIHFDRSQEIPIIVALVIGRLKYERVRLVFDSGCGTTQIHAGVIKSIGYSERDAKRTTYTQGAAGDRQEGFILSIKELQVFGKPFTELDIAAHDFSRFSRHGIDGLLGFDVIKQLRFELDGPQGIIKLF